MPPTPIPPPCPHLAAYHSLQPSHPLHHSLHIRPLGRPSIKLIPSSVPRCAACPSPSLAPRLYLCLTCSAVHCPAHAPAHSHHIALDLDRAELFCCACRDQIYDPGFDAAVALAQSAAAPPRRPGAAAEERVRKRPRSLPRDDEGDVGLVSAGLRGLNNLGNTCFLNSVLQALLHAPLLRNYFLGDRHNRFVCRRMNAALCLCCDLDAMYSAVFSGDRAPYSPVKFLYSWWQHASHLASSEQQDAHDFFITMLDGIHEKEHEQCKPHSEGNIGSGDCCIVHKVFSGILRSDVTCTMCGYTSTTFDPFMDISLDLDYSNDYLKSSSSSSHVCNGESDYLVLTQKCGMSTLLGCLERFTRPERLGSDQKLFCEHCQVKQESLKQLSIRKLPLVACFHIKRFEHSLQRNMAKKIDRYVQFPFHLNMRQFLSSSILRSRFGNRMFSINDGDSDADLEIASEFEIFAVITHNGTLESGHYTTYLRQSNQWYKCDDSWITLVSENTVRASQAYMLFYVQKILH